MNRHQRVLADLDRSGTGELVCHGNSMLPILPNPSHCQYRRQRRYTVGDIVLCKVMGRMIDAHKIVRVRPDGAYLIANNRGRENGWTHLVYGKVIQAKNGAGEVVYETSTQPHSSSVTPL